MKLNILKLTKTLKENSLRYENPIPTLEKQTKIKHRNMDKVQYKNKGNILCKNLTTKTLNAFFEFNE